METETNEEQTTQDGEWRYVERENEPARNRGWFEYTDERGWMRVVQPAEANVRLNALTRELAEARRERDEYKQRKDGAYEERNRVVAALARLYPSGLARTAIEGWDEEWNGCVYIDTPQGQLSWHFHDSQACLFDGLSQYEGVWDGHTTPEKYERLARLDGDDAARLRGLVGLYYEWCQPFDDTHGAGPIQRQAEALIPALLAEAAGEAKS